MWTIFEKSTEERTNAIVSVFSSKPTTSVLIDVLNISIEKAELLLKGAKIKTDCGFYKLSQQ